MRISGKEIRIIVGYAVGSLLSETPTIQFFTDGWGHETYRYVGRGPVDRTFL